MEFVGYDEGALPGLAELLQNSFPLHEISVRSIRRVTLEDPNFLPTDLLLAHKEGRLSGAALGARYRREPANRAGDPNSFLKAICSSPFDGGLMHDLLQRMEERMRREGATSLVYSNFASWHLLPGVDLRYENLLDFLRSEGFAKYDQCVDYLIDLQAFRVPRRIAATAERLTSEGITTRLARPDEKERVRAWVLRASGFNWSYEASRAMDSVEGGVWLAEEGSELVGFSVFGGLEHHWFGPIGVSEERRKMGLGSVLLFKGLESMKGFGLPRAVIPWTGHLFFYSQVPGIVGMRHYWMMRKEL
jgi:hypothetical protein